MKTGQTMGLAATELELVQRLCAASPGVERALLFGSRATCKHRPGSDVDLALEGAALTAREVAVLYGAFDESMLPYKVDLVVLDAALSPEMRASVKRDCVEIFRR